jgi:NAD(P)-dependent dehydrogenase (short-subunit alcohol dehydrogenase family)
MRRACGGGADASLCYGIAVDGHASSSPECRRALVTGASSGIGEATARRLAREGYRVAVLARRASELDRVLRELDRASDGSPHLALVCDLGDPEEIARACAALEREFGGLDLLVNNAGIGYRARVEEMEAKTIERVFRTNVVSILVLARSALPLLRRSARPVVVNVSSVVGRRGLPGQAAYSASKAAVSSIGEALRVEWAREGIAVCTLEPALTATGFFEAQENPASLSDPDLSRAAPAAEVAREILELDRRPRPVRSMRWKWRLLGVLSQLHPRLADRLLARRIGGDWGPPTR